MALPTLSEDPNKNVDSCDNLVDSGGLYWRVFSSERYNLRNLLLCGCPQKTGVFKTEQQLKGMPLKATAMLLVCNPK